MVARAQVLPDAVVVPIAASGELSITQALLRLLDTIAPAPAAEPEPRPSEAGPRETGPGEAAQVPSAR